MHFKFFIKLIRKHTRKNSLLRKAAVFLCERIGGHEASSDVGYSGGGMLDTWCKHCDGMYQIPVLETKVSGIFRDLMGTVEPPPNTGGSSKNSA